MHSAEMSEPRLGGDFLVSVAPLTDAAGHPGGAVHVASDISELKRLQRRLETAAYTDELTGLFNRRGFFTLAGKQVELAQRRQARVGLLYVDINLMKEINDRWGHQEGDQALQDTADLLRRTFRKSDIIARSAATSSSSSSRSSRTPAPRRRVLANLRRALASTTPDRPALQRWS